jgi:hypothetical protein
MELRGLEKKYVADLMLRFDTLSLGGRVQFIQNIIGSFCSNCGRFLEKVECDGEESCDKRLINREIT